MQKWLKYLGIAILMGFMGFAIIKATMATTHAQQGSNATITNPDGSINADEVIRRAYNNWRGQESSYAVVRMVITKTDRVDTLRFRSWAKGDKHTLTEFTDPPRNKGEGLLMIGDTLWTYSPKSGQSIKIAQSMKGNTWMGSDLSYDDISRTSDQLTYYVNKLVSTTTGADGKKIYIIDSIPKPSAPVVWGREQGAYREDFAMLWRDFYDQGGGKVRRFETSQITSIAGHQYPMHIQVHTIDKPGTKTEMITETIDFSVNLDESFFSLYTLQKTNK